MVQEIGNPKKVEIMTFGQHVLTPLNLLILLKSIGKFHQRE